VSTPVDASGPSSRLDGVTHTDRPAARVLLVDAEGRTLLFRGGDPARPGQRWWFTPGGGLAPGETSVQGAARELFEETGLRVEPAELGEPFWHQITEFTYNSRWYRQSQDFFLLRVPQWQVDTSGFDADERAVVDEHRWWTADEIEATDETVYPEELPGLLRTCLSRGPARRTAGDAVPRGGSRC
jgi:8-oxo-dGTP pyrophosphatase MutT (NUDIX family)